MLISSHGNSTSHSSFVALVLLCVADFADCPIRSCWCVIAFALALVGVCSSLAVALALALALAPDIFLRIV